MEGTFVNHLNGKLFFETVARIVSEQYGVEVTVAVRPKGQAAGDQDKEHNKDIFRNGFDKGVKE